MHCTELLYVIIDLDDQTEQTKIQYESSNMIVYVNWNRSENWLQLIWGPLKNIQDCIWQTASVLCTAVLDIKFEFPKLLRGINQLSNLIANLTSLSKYSHTLQVKEFTKEVSHAGASKRFEGKWFHPLLRQRVLLASPYIAIFTSVGITCFPSYKFSAISTSSN